MKKQKLLVFSTVIVAVCFLVVTVLLYYRSKYENDFNAFHTMAPNAVILRSRIVAEPPGKFSHECYFEVNKPVWFFANEIKRSQPTSGLDLKAIESKAKSGRCVWFMGEFRNPDSSYVYCVFSSGKLDEGVKAKLRHERPSLVSGMIVDSSATTVLVIKVFQPDPIEKALSICGLYK